MKKILLVVLCLFALQAKIVVADVTHNLELGSVKGAGLVYSVGSATEDSYLYGSIGLGSIGFGYEHVINESKDITFGGNVFKAIDTTFGSVGFNFYQNGVNKPGWYASVGALILIKAPSDDQWFFPAQSDDEGEALPGIAFGYRF